AAGGDRDRPGLGRQAMKYGSVAVLAVALAASAAPAQNPPWAQKIFSGATGHDFGTVPHGAQRNRRLPIKTLSAVPLAIPTVRVSCSCLSYNLSKQPFEPQEEGYVDVLMDASRFKGPKSVYMYLTVGPNFISTAVMQFTAN